MLLERKSKSDKYVSQYQCVYDTYYIVMGTMIRCHSKEQDGLNFNELLKLSTFRIGSSYFKIFKNLKISNLSRKFHKFQQLILCFAFNQN